jgi:class 3 adenylate cyclase
VLFCDLVGFTERAEEMDPEDVASLLGPYQARVKHELERHGGTVEKFIGDAVMALFGAPAVHEDDPDRAVRAALAIREFAGEAGIDLRVGITTGEALVTLGARPEYGETMATGDVVNTAARLQAAAPVNGILVSEKAYEATKKAIEYEAAEPVQAKGKSRPVPVWRALRRRSRIVLERLHASALVGREREVAALTGALARARDERQAQLVTLVGVPGIGKSRLVYELAQEVNRDSELIAWRQGRCPAYGEGVTFWALGEIVKAHAGILESDPSEVVGEKLTRIVGDEWTREQLRPLVGLGNARAAGADGREEAFAAWRGFLEGVAAERPLVAVFEDVHWADDNLLDFVDHLVDWAAGVALLVICTARPELFERRRAWGGGKTNALTISLSPLADSDTAHLVAEVVQQSVMPAETQQLVLERAGGNPLYAEQFAQLLTERSDVETLPETVQGIIAGRLDLLPFDQKSLIQDAAVVGETFWLGAVVAISDGDLREAQLRLHALERKGFVRRERESSIAGDTEYAFQHVLLQEVAYGQIPRADRARRHVGVAEWINGLGRLEDQAELLAHHYSEALQLARAAGMDARPFEHPARGAFRDAGDRALALNAYVSALSFYERSLKLWPEANTERGHLLFRRAKAHFLAVDDHSPELFEAARDELLGAGDRETAAEAETLGALALRNSGWAADAVARARKASELLEDAPPSPAKVHVQANLARLLVLVVGSDEGVAIGEGALRMAEQLGLDEFRAHALNTIGLGKIGRGDLGGLVELEASLEIALAHGSPFELVRVYNNLEGGYFYAGRLEDASATLVKLIELRQRLGLPTQRDRAGLAFNDFVAGDWSSAVELMAGMDADARKALPWAGLAADLAFAKDDLAGAVALAEHMLETLRGRQGDIETLSFLQAALGFRAELALAEERDDLAHELVDELLSMEIEPVRLFPVAAVELSLVLFDVGRLHEWPLSKHDRDVAQPWLAAAVAISRRELNEAAQRLALLGARTYEAHVRLRAAAELRKADRAAEADRELRAALVFFRSAGATRYVREAEELVAATG